MDTGKLSYEAATPVNGNLEKYVWLEIYSIVFYFSSQVRLYILK